MSLRKKWMFKKNLNERIKKKFIKNKTTWQRTGMKL